MLLVYLDRRFKLLFEWGVVEVFEFFGEVVFEDEYKLRLSFVI